MDKLEQLVEFAIKNDIALPADVILNLAKRDAQRLVDNVKVSVNVPEFGRNNSGIVPAPKGKDLVLTSDGWKKQLPTSINMMTGGASHSSTLAYGMYSSSDTQAVAVTSDAQVITFSSIELSYNIDHTSAGRFTVRESGVYLITFSGVAKESLSDKTHIEMWLRVGGVDVARSNTRVELATKETEWTVVVSFLYKFTSGNFFELWTCGDSLTTSWLATNAGSNPTRPACPSVIMTVNKISD
jgi:hypothetical protein